MLYIAYAVLWLLRFALGACVFSFLGVWYGACRAERA